jgi:hypothetical protein
LLVAATAAFADVAQAQPQPEVSRTLALQVQIHFPPPGESKPVSFELVHNHLLFRAMVEGHEVWALLDNGLAGSAVDSGFAKLADLKLGPPAGRALTATGSLERRLVTDVRFEIPGQMEVRAPLQAIDLSVVSKLSGRPVSLIIGKDYFDILAFFVSSTTSTFQLAPSGAMHVPPGTARLDLKNGEPQRDVMIAGKTAVVTPDLGSDLAIGLSASAWNRLGLSATAEGKLVGANGRTASTMLAIVDTISIGPIWARNLRVTVAPMLPSTGDGIIGMGFFSRYDFVIDQKARHIWLSPLAGRPAASSSTK